VFTGIWAVIIIIPAILYSRSTGSILETLSQVGSYFVGAQLGMFALGFFSKHANERGLLIGTVAGFAVVWYVAVHTDIAWPWYCLIGAVSNFVMSSVASIALEGFKTRWSPYSIKGQLAKYRDEGLPEKEGGWYCVPGRIDRLSYVLLAFFFVMIGLLLLFEQVI
jgi:SSS family solute:Na+ symporter